MIFGHVQINKTGRSKSHMNRPMVLPFLINGSNISDRRQLTDNKAADRASPCWPAALLLIPYRTVPCCTVATTSYAKTSYSYGRYRTVVAAAIRGDPGGGGAEPAS